MEDLDINLLRKIVENEYQVNLMPGNDTVKISDDDYYIMMKDFADYIINILEKYKKIKEK